MAGLPSISVLSVSSSRFDSNPVDNTDRITVPVGLYRFHTLEPCRLVDTRETANPLLAAADRTFALRGRCGVPATARALSLNVTVTEPTAAGDLRLSPAGASVESSSINYGTGQTRAAFAVVALSASGEITVHCDQEAGQVQLILDVTGYFE